MRILLEIFAPLSVAVQDKDALSALIYDLGWEVRFDETQTEAFATVIGIKDDITRIAELVEQLANEGLNGNVLGEVITVSEGVFNSVQGLMAIDPDALASLPHPFDKPDTWGDMALRLPDHLVTSWLRVEYEPVYEMLRFVGLVTEQVLPAPPDGQERVIDRVNWAALPEFLTDPMGLMAQTYGWNAEFDHAKLLGNFAALAAALGFPPDLRPARPELRADWGDAPGAGDALEINLPIVHWTSRGGAARFNFDLVLAPALSGGSLQGLQLTNFTTGAIDAELDLGEGWRIGVEAEGDLDQLISLSAFPSGVEFDLDASGAEASAEFTLTGEPEEPWVLIGSRTGPRLELARLSMGVGTQMDVEEQEVHVFATTMGGEPGLKLVISPAEGDSFLSDILGGEEMAITADLGVLWSSQTGFRFEGGVGFDVAVALDKRLGPILLSGFRMGLSGGTEGATLELAVSGGLDISVMAVSVEDIGLRATATPVAEGEGPGLLGPLDLKLGFKPPKGLGLVIDAAGILTGGGYLYHDEALAEYGGVAELGFLSVKLSAIGILTTRMPDGSDGWSLFLAVFSEFPPIQLAFGFTLNGVGGLVGLHRSFDEDALRERLLAGALDSIMFPENPVANAPRILDDIRAVFPPSQGQFVFGAMLKFGWGTPTILTLDLGVIVELPDPIKIALLGQLNMSLPTPDKTILELNMDVFGLIDITRGTVALDAVIRDSHILGLLTLSGAMAFRASFGDAPTMLLSIGGFHPKFTPPAGVPALGRLKASLPVGNLASVELSGYVAVTSNTFQTGGRIDIWVRAAGFSAEGYFGFDALIQFSPFGFAFTVEFGVSVRAGKVTLMAIAVDAAITGPGPWLIDGQASFKILGVKKKLEVDLQVGRKKNVPVPATDVEALLIAALEEPANWSVDLPAGAATSAVVLSDASEDATPRVHPGGRILFRQTLVPLNLKLDKYGAGTVIGRDQFSFDSARIGNGPEVYSGDQLQEEWFAPAEFIAMKDAKKLKAPSFEKFDCGIAIPAGQASTFGPSATMTEDFEEITLDPALNRRLEGREGKPVLLAGRDRLKPEAEEGPALRLKPLKSAFLNSRIRVA